MPATVSANVPLDVTGEPATDIRPPVKLPPTLVTVALLVLHVGQEIAPVEAIAIGDVPLKPALPMFPIGIAVGKSPGAIARKAGEVAVANRAKVVVAAAGIVELACKPPPITTPYCVSDAALVTHVGQESVFVLKLNGELNVAVKSEIAGCV